IGSGIPDFYPQSWSESLFRWIMAQTTDSTILVLSTVDETGLVPRYLEQLGHDRVATLTISERYIADDPAVAARLDAAGGIIVLDRDPGQILNLWKGTRTEAAMQRAFSGGRVLVGMGGGAQALLGLIPDAGTRSTTPGQVVRRPVAATMTCELGLTGSVGEIFVEPFFTRRARLPLLMNVMARRRQQNNAAVILGLGIDEQTGVIWSADDHLTVHGAGAVSFLRFTSESVIRLDPRLPPVITALALDQLTEGFMINLSTAEVVLVPETATTGFSSASLVISGDQVLEGARIGHPQPGVWEVTQLDRHSYALQRGLLDEVFGEGRFDGIRLITGAFINADHDENRLGGLTWTLANHPGSWGILMDRGSKADLLASGSLVPLPMTDQPGVLVIDATRLGHRDYSRFKTHLDGRGPRQSVALTNLRLHLIATRCDVNLRSGVVTVRP
ncbi:MAG TPA: hypothetical protein PKO06_16360, partial [Candidatus Ozemobacteraceae bacterium]|nr:hypothetical protein [Candidatus Ozemobacteraceae bacterium]